VPYAVIRVRKVDRAARLIGPSRKRNMLRPKCVPVNTHLAYADRNSVASLHSISG
jgi:hypothetical protein